jgi:hypothetical protein
MKDILARARDWYATGGRNTAPLYQRKAILRCDEFAAID